MAHMRTPAPERTPLNKVTTMDSIYQHLEARQRRRLAAEHRFLCRMEKREAAAEKMIGELVRDGKEVLYVWPQGGKYREGSHGELIAFLLRNNYA
ncbi:hypothetical protein ACUXLG_005675 [Ralstonia sp. 121560039-2]|jgi:hypothetical protein